MRCMESEKCELDWIYGMFQFTRPTPRSLGWFLLPCFDSPPHKAMNGSN